jgi:predicted transcriptional regulator
MIVHAEQIKNEVETKEPSTKLEKFLSKKGNLIIKDFYDLGVAIGDYGSETEFKALVIYEPYMSRVKK